jgi:hypothetical protein
MRHVLHFYIDAVCTVVFFMSMPVTLIASETEREIDRQTDKQREKESESRKFIRVFL